MTGAWILWAVFGLLVAVSLFGLGYTAGFSARTRKGDDDERSGSGPDGRGDEGGMAG